jgi:hypothetical protein
MSCPTLIPGEGQVTILRTRRRETHRYRQSCCQRNRLSSNRCQSQNARSLPLLRLGPVRHCRLSAGSPNIYTDPNLACLSFCVFVFLFSF